MVNRDAPRFSARVGCVHTVADASCGRMVREAPPAHEEQVD
jgi:hypothetical protein